MKSKFKIDYEGFIGQVTAGLDDTDLTAKEVVEYMEEHDEMPEGVDLWEPLEGSSPAQLVKNGLGYKDKIPKEIRPLISAVKALGKAIENGDPQRITDRYMNVRDAIKALED